MNVVQANLHLSIGENLEDLDGTLESTKISHDDY
jgi:hypothetical protein